MTLCITPNISIRKYIYLDFSDLFSFAAFLLTFKIRPRLMLDHISLDQYGGRLSVYQVVGEAFIRQHYLTDEWKYITTWPLTRQYYSKYRFYWIYEQRIISSKV